MMLLPSPTRPAAWIPGSTVAVVLAVVLLAGTAAPQASPQAPPTSTDPARPATADPGESALLTRVRAALQEERRQLLRYAYRERRRPLKVSPLGKVSLGPVQVFDVLPAPDVDRPRRVLVSVDGRPATAEEREDYAKRHPPPGLEPADEREERERRRAEARRKAQERFEDAFRIFAFEAGATEVIDGRTLRRVQVTPRPQVEPKSDMGRWMRRFTGTAWIDETDAQLVRLELVATDTISIGWGFIGRIARGTALTYTRRATAGGQWFPATLRFEASGRTLLFRSFEVDTATEWYDYRLDPAAAESATR